MKSTPFLFTGYSLFFAFLPSAAALRSCYYPDGTLSGDTPCNTTTSGHSGCCSAQCMSSGLCFDHGLVSRGSCTDSTWKDAACPQFCTDFLQDAGCPIVPRQWIGSVDVDTMGWCCDFPQANGSCTQGVEVHVQAGVVLPNSTTTSASTQSSSTSTMAPTCTGGAQIFNNSTCEANHDAAIGAGIGVPAAIAVASLLLLLLRERRLRKRSNERFEAIPQEKPGETPNVNNGNLGVWQEADGTPSVRKENLRVWPRYEADGTPSQNELP